MLAVGVDLAPDGVFDLTSVRRCDAALRFAGGARFSATRSSSSFVPRSRPRMTCADELEEND